MPLLPLIQRPCPYLDRLESVMDSDFCRMCRRDVHDLTALDEAGRRAFIADCGGDVCIRFRFDAKPALAAALIAASIAVPVAAAQAGPRSHAVRRVPHPPRTVRVQPVSMVTAGLPAMVEPPRIEPPRPPEPPADVPSQPPAGPKMTAGFTPSPSRFGSAPR